MVGARFHSDAKSGGPICNAVLADRGVYCTLRIATKKL
jgi:hypothetical protein